jgi:hypothetical protein
MISDELLRTRARGLGAAIEPFVGQVYFSPECHQAYEQLGFAGSPADLNGVAMPDGQAYFCSRGAVLGQVPGEVVAAAFGVFNPAVVVPLVTEGWKKAPATSMCAARTDGALGQLTRILGDRPDGLERATELLERANERLRPEGRALYAGLVGLGVPDTPLGVAWRLADRLREFRGDVHIAAWTSAGLDATEIGLLSELYWGLPMRTYILTRAWSVDDMDAAEARLVAKGYLADGAFTDAGRAAREQIEDCTDRLCRPIIESLGDDYDELTEIVGGWSGAVQAGKGYPDSGPHDLARLASGH